jgi:glucose-1-phosphate cytidylyltransferase
MKVVILAGGVGTRLQEETVVKPKPMVEIGGRPILWHIMKHYAHFGFNEFIIALGYKSEIIKQYFLDYYTLNSNFTVDLSNGNVQVSHKECENWTVHLVDTGQHTLTGGRIKRLKPWIEGETFMVTYGDGVANIDLQALLQFHYQQKRIATVTAVRPPARYGGLMFNGNLAAHFSEKPQAGEGWINGGYLVFEPNIFNYLPDDQADLAAYTLEKLAADEQLAAYRHDNFWQCMDTMRDAALLEKLWQQENPPWKIWEQ